MQKLKSLSFKLSEWIMLGAFWILLAMMFSGDINLSESTKSVITLFFIISVLIYESYNIDGNKLSDQEQIKKLNNYIISLETAINNITLAEIRTTSKVYLQVKHAKDIVAETKEYLKDETKNKITL